MNPFKILKQLLPMIIDVVIAPLLLPWILANQKRAQTIEVIALAVAGQLVSEFPDKEWAALVELAVRRLAEALPPGARTDNADVLRRAAEAALRQVGAAKFPAAPVK